MFRLLSLLLGVVLLLQLSACGGGGGPALGDSRLPLSVTSRTPSPGNANVSVHEPVSVTFSKPVDATTVTDSSVIVTGEGSVLLGKTMALSADGTTLTIDLISSPSVPNTLTVTLTETVKDLAGNALTLPNDEWSFATPSWLKLGDALSAAIGVAGIDSASLAVDGSGNQVVAWSEADGSTDNIYVHRWTGTSWNQLGGPLSANGGTTSAGFPSIALDDSSNPVVAWQETDGTADNVYVRRWNGTSWDQLGGALSAHDGATIAGHPSIALDESGNPTVSWHESDGTISNVHVSQWDGSTWNELGGPLSANHGDTYSAHPSIAVGDSGRPTVAWQESDLSGTNVYVQQWNGTGWTQLGGALFASFAATTLASYPSLAVDDSGDPTVAWFEADGSTRNIYVRRWDGSYWTTLGLPLSANGGDTFAEYPSLALDASGNPTVAWHEEDGTSINVYVQRWDGDRWLELGSLLSASPSNTPARYPSVALDASGVPSVAWEESGKIHVRRYNQ